MGSRTRRNRNNPLSGISESLLDTEHMPRVIAVIPARGGSKGIPRKNLVSIAGRPLLEYSVEQAKAASLVGEVIVSTDDSEIADVASDMGATVVQRPQNLSGDTASSESAILHALDVLHDRDGHDPDLVVFLQATSPLRTESAIDEAINHLIKSGADSVFSACQQHGFVWRIGSEVVESVTYDYRHRSRRQELPEHVVENGSIYVFKPWVLRQLGNRLGGHIEIYRMGALYSFQIDEPSDVEIIENLINLLACRSGRENQRREG